MKNLILFLIVCLVSPAIFAQDITGSWNGILKVQAQQIPLVFHINIEDIGYTATMDSPAQGAKDIPVNTVSFEASVLKLEVTAAGISYEGILGLDSIFTGTFKQGGMSLPLNLSREEVKKEEVKRPQEPGKPYPYVVEEVKFINAHANIELAGTLTLPGIEGNYPAVVLISGSGPQDRNEEIMGHKPFLVLADYLTKNGIAVLRYDDRGVGESTGQFSEATTFDLANDAASAFKYLQSRKEINKHQIGLIGHSEGGIIAPMIASENMDISFIVLMAGSAMRGDQLLLLQKSTIDAKMGATQYLIDLNQEILSGAYNIIINNQAEVPVIKDSLSEYLSSDYGNIIPENQRNTIVNQLTGIWWINFIRLDPAVYLSKVSCPVLALNGDKDLQVPAAENLEIIQSELTKGGNTNFEIIEFEGLNHLLQESETGLPGEYGEIEQTIAPEVLEAISNWILETVNE